MWPKINFDLCTHNFEGAASRIGTFRSRNFFLRARRDDNRQDGITGDTHMTVAARTLFLPSFPSTEELWPRPEGITHSHTSRRRAGAASTAASVNQQERGRRVRRGVSNFIFQFLLFPSVPQLRRFLRGHGGVAVHSQCGCALRTRNRRRVCERPRYVWENRPLGVPASDTCRADLTHVSMDTGGNKPKENRRSLLYFVYVRTRTAGDGRGCVRIWSFQRVFTPLTPLRLWEKFENRFYWCFW